MNFTPPEDEAMIAETAARFLREWRASSPVAVTTGQDSALWSEFAEMGWLAMPLDEAAGGIGAPASTLAVLLESLGYERINVPYLSSIVHGLGVLDHVSGDRRDALVQAVAAGEALLGVIDRGISAEGSATQRLLSGQARLVPGGGSATTFLVVVVEGGEAILYAVPADTDGLHIAPVVTIDGSSAADVTLDRVEAAEPLARGHQLDQAIDLARDRVSALSCADAAGAVAALIERTIDFTHTRKQFGKSLRSFQVVDHAIADMQTALEEVRAAVQLAIGKIGTDPDSRKRAIAAARVKIGERGREVGHAAIQLHGAMGVTDELDIGAYLKRLIAIDVAGGARETYLDRYATQAREGKTRSHLAETQGQHSAPDFGLSDEGRSFRDAMVAFLDVAIPDEVARAQQLTPTVYAEVDIAARWQSIADQHGFAAPNWPAEFGGTGWTAEQRYIWAHETAARFVPITSPIGLSLVGPVLMHYGTPEQKRRYLRPIVDGSELWCQGFSEPGAGSDLAALATRAVRDGDEYVVTGTKMWTTHGHFARFMVALVRTSAGENRREGISFLIIDMQCPGIEVRPIMTIGGDHEVNQIFLDDVRVPTANLVGLEGQGWEIAKFLLEYERGGDIMSAGHRALLNEIRDAALSRQEQSGAFWRRFARVSIDVDVLEVMEIRSLFGAAQGNAVPSVLKLRASEIQQAVTELGADLLGQDLLRWEPHRPLYALADARPENAFASRYLNSRANTIFGGAREIQKTLIARAAG